MKCLFRSITVPFLFFFTVLANQCDIIELTREAQNLKHDINSLNSYDSFINKLEGCLREKATEKDEYNSIIKLAHQVYYKNGLIQLSAGKYFKAITSFEKIILDSRAEIPLSDSYYLLSAKRLQKLYMEFGLWNNVTESTIKISKKLEPQIVPEIEAKRELFQKSLIELKDMIRNDIHNNDIEDKLETIKNISPYNINYLYLANQFLTNNLIDGEAFDITRIMMLKENYERLLDVHITTLSLDERLSLHHNIAVIQLFLVGQDPLAQGSSSHLRKCLNIDMDYAPCKELILIASKLNKINPDLKEIKDENTYRNLDASEGKWSTMVNFYLKDKINLKSKLLPNNYRSVLKNNYEVMEAIQSRNLKEYFGVDEKVSSEITTNLFVNIDIGLCQAATLTKILDKKQVHLNCQKAMFVIGDNYRNDIKNSMSQGNTMNEDVFEDLRNTYPHIFALFVKNALKKFGASSQGQNLINQILKIWESNDYKNAHNPYLKAITKQIEKIMNRRREEQAQRQQQQQQFFRQQQQQQQQQQFQQQNGLTNDQAAKNYYKILGVTPEANSKEIRRAYLGLTKKFHPDKQGKKLTEEEDKKNHEKMSEINEAYEILNDEDKRKEYDSIRTGSPKFNAQNNFRPNGRGFAGGFPGGFPFGGGFGF